MITGEIDDGTTTLISDHLRVSQREVDWINIHMRINKQRLNKSIVPTYINTTM